MKIIIVGCGRVGASLAQILDTPEDDITVIDTDAQAFGRLSSDFQGRRIVGTGYDEEVLRQAGIDECDAFAAVTSSDNANLMASEIARRLYDVPYVVTRLINPERNDLYQQLGLDCICDTDLVAENISAKIRSRNAQHLDTFGDYEVLTFELDTGGSVMHVRELEALGDIKIYMLKRDDEAALTTPNMFVHDGDTLLAIVHSSDLPALGSYMKGSVS